MEWQDISTAPKDGTWILVYEAVDWPANLTPTYHVVAWLPWSSYGKSGFEWQTLELGPTPDSYSPNPSHWMPLPTPPNGQQTGGVVAQGGEG